VIEHKKGTKNYLETDDKVDTPPPTPVNPVETGSPIDIKEVTIEIENISSTDIKNMEEIVLDFTEGKKDDEPIKTLDQNCKEIIIDIENPVYTLK